MAEETINCEVAWDSKGNALFAIIPMELVISNHLSINEAKVLCIDGEVDNTSEEIIRIKDGKAVMVE